MYHQKYFKLHIVQEDTLNDFLNLFKKAKQVFWDTETSGLNVRAVGKDYTVGFTYAFDDATSKDVFYVPVRHVFEGKYEDNGRFSFLKKSQLEKFPDFCPEKFEGTYYNVDSFKFAAELKSIMECGGKEYIAHNQDYDLHLLANEGIDIYKVFDVNTFQDTQIMVHTLDENVEKNLESVTKMIFKVEKSHYSDTIKTVTKEEKLSQGLKATNNASFQHVQIPIGAQYSAEDVWFMKQMYPMLVKGLKEDDSYDIYLKCRMPFMKALWKMERKGVSVDIAALDKMQELAEKELENSKYKMFSLAGVEFNPDSGQHLYEILFGFKKKVMRLTPSAQNAFEIESVGYTTTEKTKLKNLYMNEPSHVMFVESCNNNLVDVNFGFKPIEFTTGGKYGYEELQTPKTGGDILKALLKQKNVDAKAHDFITELVTYKKLSKLISAFMIGLRENIYSDGKVHCSFNICGCLEGNTLIPTDKGIFPIKDLAKGTLFNTPKALKLPIVNRDLQLEDTQYIVKYHDKETVKIKTALGMTLEASREHPIVACKYHKVKNNSRFKRYKGTSENECWKKVSDIEVGDHIIVPYNYNVFAKEYKELSYKDIPSGGHITKKATLPAVLDEDVAEFMGMYYADGCIADTNGTFRFSFTNGNSDVVQRLKELSSKLFGIDARVYTKENSATIEITSKMLTPLEDALMLKRGCINKVIPSIILESPKSVVQSFIRGMTLDSCVLKEASKLYLRFTLSNHISAKYLQEILLNMGIISAIRQDTSKTLNVFYLSLYNEEYEKFKNEIGFVESCKYVETTRAQPKKVHHNGYTVVDEHKLYVRVKEVSEDFNDVYDFVVPRTHSFISMPFISHNTDSWRLSSQYPNIQQLPHPLEEPKAGEDRTYFDFWERFEIRKLFIADEGYSVIACDYHALEKYLTAHLSQDKMLLKMLRENLDPHGTVATIVFPELANMNPNDVKKLEPAKRQIAKKIGFAKGMVK